MRFLETETGFLETEMGFSTEGGVREGSWQMPEVGGMVAPKRYVHILTPGTYAGDFVWKKGPRSHHQVKDLKLRSSWIIWMGPQPSDKCPSKIWVPTPVCGPVLVQSVAY